MAANIKTLKDANGVDIIYPQTKSTAVFTNDNKTVETALQEKLSNPTGTAGQFLGFTADNVVGAVDSPVGGGSFYNKSFTGTLGTAWQGTAAPYYQQFTVADMDNTMAPLVFPQWSTFPASEAQKAAWNSIYSSVESFNGYVRFYTNTKTTTAVNFIMYYGNPEKPRGGEPVSLINNNVEPATVRNGQFFEDV